MAREKALNFSDWRPEAPDRPGAYWLYGDESYGTIGEQVRLESPPDFQYHFVEVWKISNRLMAATRGRFVALRPFDPVAGRSGYVGMWRWVAMPPTPEDVPEPEEWLEEQQKAQNTQNTQMSDKKRYLITCMWSWTTEVELPEGTSLDDIESFTPPKDVDKAVCERLNDVAQEFNWKDLVVTDLQEKENGESDEI